MDENNISAAIEAGKGLSEPRPAALPDGSVGFIIPEGFSIEKVAPIDPLLTRIKAAPRFDDIDSFVEYVSRFKSADTVTFADIKANRLTAIIDYHHAGDGGPDHGVHRPSHPCPWSLDWERWRNVDGKSMKQAELGLFLEEMLHTIAEPTGAALLEVAGELKIDREVTFKSASRLNDGTNSFIYEEKDDTKTTKGKMAVPEDVTIVSPVFMGGAACMFKAKLRYKLDRGELSFRICILNRLDGEQKAFGAVVSTVREAVGQPVFYGAPA